ncbi:uncharacterized protein BCR38DRAFT_508311 [Pseudomassariella vexata]|uniref:Uncharacterized protein n=1 Tax=Pseudomassariella vexata TaxID=1141098 RepID=A0A1Y2EBM4_9PEZI|nr:uncharacterized protein BCR38DRAFT_508311 [Pseudomassariella vexata]ORY68960.1 hypothetical protein BCR38DRAFT_508311 [Pseudomassariella vexata]
MVIFAQEAGLMEEEKKTAVRIRYGGCSGGRQGVAQWSSPARAKGAGSQWKLGLYGHWPALAVLVGRRGAWGCSICQHSELGTGATGAAHWPDQLEWCRCIFYGMELSGPTRKDHLRGVSRGRSDRGARFRPKLGIRTQVLGSTWNVWSGGQLGFDQKSPRLLIRTLLSTLLGAGTSTRITFEIMSIALSTYATG